MIPATPRVRWSTVILALVSLAGIQMNAVAAPRASDRGSGLLVPRGAFDAILPPTASTSPAAGRARVHSLDNVRRIDANRLNMFVSNFGSFGYDVAGGGAGLYFPKGTTHTTLFAGGL